MNEEENVQTALLNMQSELKVGKDNYNDFGGFNYRSKEDILEALKPLCEKYGCIITIDDSVVLIGDRFYCCSCAKLFHVKSSSKICCNSYAREQEVKKGMDEAQITGATASYAAKRALGNLFALDDTSDIDAAQQEQKDARTLLLDACTQYANAFGYENTKEIASLVFEQEGFKKTDSCYIHWTQKLQEAIKHDYDLLGSSELEF